MTRRTLPAVLLSFLLLGSAANGAPAVGAAERFNGVYVTNNDEINVVALSANKLSVTFDLMGETKAYNSGAAAGEATLVGNTATYASNQFGPCKITLVFEPHHVIRVTQQGGPFDCGFGNGVTADGDYRRKSVLGKLVLGSSSAPATPAALERLITTAKTDASVDRQDAERALERVTTLTGDLKAKKAAVTTAGQDVKKHETAAKTAYQKFFKASNNPKSPPGDARAALELARTEYEAAHLAALNADHGFDDVKSLRAELVKTVGELSDMTYDANAVSTDAANALKDLKKHSAPAAKGVTPDPALTSASNEADEIKKAASATKQSVSSANGKAGLGTEQAMTSAAKQLEKDKNLAHFKASTLEGQLAEVKYNLTLGSAPQKVCDIHKLDWQNLTYPGGKLQHSSDPMTADDYEPGDTSYADLSGNGVLEAYVPVLHLYGANNNDGVIYGFELDPSCVLRFIGSISMGRDASFVVDKQGLRETEGVWKDEDPRCCASSAQESSYKVTDGTLKLVKTKPVPVPH